MDVVKLMHLQTDPSSKVAHLDVRLQARTDSDSFYVHYHGVMKFDEAISNWVSRSKEAKSTEFGDHEWFMSPRFETSSKEFKWIESAMFLGRGRCIVDGDEIAVEYEIFKVVNQRSSL